MASRTQKRASANAGRTANRRQSTSRASVSRSTRTTRGTSSRSPARGRSAGASRAKKRGTSPVAGVAMIAVVIVAAWSVYPVLKLQYEHQSEVRTLEAELAGLKERNGELRQEVDALKTPEGVEQLARETLGLVKPGEQAYVVTGGAAEDTSSTAESAAESKPLWQSMLDAVFGLE